MIPKDSIYDFCVNGIINQKLFSSPDSTFATINRRSSSNINNLFKTPWYCFGSEAKQKDSSGGSDALGSLTSRTALRTSTMLKKAFGTARQLSQSGSSSGYKLRFSRQSTTSVLFDGLGGDTVLCEDGVFVSLCRVLICNMKTISGSVTEEDIAAAYIDGCDAIFCSSRLVVVAYIMI